MPAKKNHNASAAEGRISWLKARYLDTMQQRNLKKVQGSAYTLSIRESDTVVVPADVSTLPDIYLRRKETVEADKTVIKESLKGGIDVPGCKICRAFSLQVR